MSIPLSTVKHLWLRYSKSGEAGLQNNYKNCGAQPVGNDYLMYRATRWLKYLHPSWGAGRIRAGLCSRYGDSGLPCERTMQRWFASGKLTEPKEMLNAPRIGASRAVHNIWQVDAKEQLTLSDGSLCCYLTFTDEYSGAWLGSVVFGHYHVNQVSLENFRGNLIKMFERWGKSGALRVDNGLPLGNPKMSSTTPLALWLIAMDVDMIWNKPACPQQNAKVERAQGTSSRWSEISKCRNIEHLQKRLDEEAVVQRENFRVTRLKMKTRLEAFPELETSRRFYDASTFNAQRVYDFLGDKKYVRKTTKVGQLELYGQLFNVSTKYGKLWIQIKFDAQNKNWLFFDDVKMIATIKAEHLSGKNILNLTVCQRT